MSHLHMPDGVLPLWIVLLGWGLTAVLLALAVRSMQGDELEYRLPLVGVVAALMLVGMNLELAPLGYHVNLAALAGIFLGPALGFVAAFVVNLMLAFLGHGGITVVGLNTLTLGSEAVLGFYAFNGLRALARGRLSVGVVSGIATVAALLLSTFLMIGIVASSSVAPDVAVADTTAGRQPGRGDQTTFALLVLGLGSVGWLIEGVATGVVVGYVARVRPDLLDGGTRVSRARKEIHGRRDD